MMDNRDKDEWPELPVDLAEKAREAVMDMGEDEEMIQAMAAFEMEDEASYPRMLFSKSFKSKMEPRKY